MFTFEFFMPALMVKPSASTAAIFEAFQQNLDELNRTLGHGQRGARRKCLLLGRQGDGSKLAKMGGPGAAGSAKK